MRGHTGDCTGNITLGIIILLLRLLGFLTLIINIAILLKIVNFAIICVVVTSIQMIGVIRSLPRIVSVYSFFT